MLMWVLLFLVAAIAVESITQIVTKSEIAKPLRDRLQHTRFLGKLSTCSSCLSVWVSAILIIGFLILPKVATVVAVIFAVRRAANWLMLAAEKVSDTKGTEEPKLYHASKEEGNIYVQQNVQVVMLQQDDGQTKISHIWTNKADAEKEVEELSKNNVMSRRRTMPLLAREEHCPSCTAL